MIGNKRMLFIFPIFLQTISKFLSPSFYSQMFFILKDTAWSDALSKKERTIGGRKNKQIFHFNFLCSLSRSFSLFVSCKMRHVIIISPSGAENYFDGFFSFRFKKNIIVCLPKHLRKISWLYFQNLSLNKMKLYHLKLR